MIFYKNSMITKICMNKFLWFLPGYEFFVKTVSLLNVDIEIGPMTAAFRERLKGSIRPMQGQKH